ncbi:DUF6221 family protein [Streptomyces sp. CRN 30]|uniref:DUF6221 family protein n=1 Tax=Streptomyces sp. CRN 30 TaxID=3075613 RepID=UPI002A83A642|nr:DUF6221 family protein [Streptomyces sp. CRN 30]
MDELVRWLGEQFDEDERSTRAATPGPWRRSGFGNYGPAVTFGRTYTGIETEDSEQGRADADHIAEHDPVRVLREIDAKRQILSLYVTAANDRETLRVRMREVVNTNHEEFGRLHQQESELIETARRLKPVVHLLGVPYADRPGYREEWRP